MSIKYERIEGPSGTWTDLLQISPEAMHAIFGQGVRNLTTDIAKMSAFYDIAMRQAINQYLQTIREYRSREAQAQSQANAIIAQSMLAAQESEERAKLADLQMKAAAFEGLGYLISETMKYFKKPKNTNTNPVLEAATTVPKRKTTRRNATQRATNAAYEIIFQNAKKI